MTAKTRIFVAHASEDKGLVRDLYSKLVNRGFKPWLDEIDLLPGQNWQIEIPKAIRESDIFIACLSRLSVRKQGYVQREFRSALSTYAEKPPGSIYLIPLKLDDCEIPDFQLPQLGISCVIFNGSIIGGPMALSVLFAQSKLLPIIPAQRGHSARAIQVLARK